MIHHISLSFLRFQHESAIPTQLYNMCLPLKFCEGSTLKISTRCIFITIFAIAPQLKVLTWHPFSKRLENKIPTDFRASSEQGSYIITGCQRHLWSKTSHKPQIERIKPFPGPNLTLRRRPFLMGFTHSSFLRIFSLITHANRGINFIRNIGI